ncbi:MAG: toprim domain-containing protein, partial [Litorilinea sp.]
VIWFVSAFRIEAVPSFNIYVQDNVWFDFGEGKGGNVLDFMMHYDRTDSIREALRRLESLAPAGSLEFAAAAKATSMQSPKKATKQESDPAIELKKVKPLENRALTSYLKKRGVSVETAQLYVQEIYYRYGEKDYFALAFPNQSGGYELRNPYFKGTYGTKDITLLHHASGNRAEVVTVFEGFIDYLSALTHYGRQEATTPVIVLNSVAMRDRAIETIRALAARTLHLYLDRDASGQAMAAYFRDHLPSLDIVDHSGLYAGHKDVSEWLEAASRQRNSRG